MGIRALSADYWMLVGFKVYFPSQLEGVLSFDLKGWCPPP